MTHAFRRYTGAGNTFIVMDGGNDPLSIGSDEMQLLVRAICDPAAGPGADGVILVNQSSSAPFRMDFYNPDGSTGMLCGNGARCAVRAASDWGYITASNAPFEVLSAINTADLLPNGEIRVHFQDPVAIELRKNLEILGHPIEASYVDVGSQHLVVFVDALKALGVEDIETLDIAKLGPLFRSHTDVQPLGANTNFVEVQTDGEEQYLRIRTFERGVEGETLACGTGCMSSAIVAFLSGRITSHPIRLKTQSEEFVVVDFRPNKSSSTVTALSLQGSAIAQESGVLFFAETTASLSVVYDPS